MSVEAVPLAAYTAIGSLSLLTIYFGARASLTSKDETPDTLHTSDAALFPILGSVVLFSLYLAFKYLDKDLLNLLFNMYFMFMSVFSLGRTILLTLSCFSSSSSSNTSSSSSRSYVRYTISAIPAAAISAYHFHFSSSSSWILGNLIALSFAFNAISLLRLDSFKTGAVLLSGLFLYDIWWVFGTPVMVSVATSFKGPIKIVWPKAYDELGVPQFTMLGLGDIVIPGIFIALALRFDHYQRTQRLEQSKSNSSSKTAKLSRGCNKYFYSTFIAYTLGLILTITIMHTFKAAQPALLYLSPACILSSFGLAVWKNELSSLLSFRDESDSESTEAAASQEIKKEVSEKKNE